MLAFSHLYEALSRTPGLVDVLTLETAIAFIRLASRLRTEITISQKPDHPPSKIPDLLPAHVRLFLAGALDLQKDFVNGCWTALAEVVWNSADSAPASVESRSESDMELFEEHARTRAVPLAKHMLHPRTLVCLNPNCCQQDVKLLRKKETPEVTLFTLAEGAVPAYSIHFYCSGCNTNYHHGYSVKDEIRTYYEGIPDVIQAGEHQFIETSVVRVFIGLMLHSWTSATNAARMYNTCLSQTSDPTSTSRRQFKPELRTEHVWDAFVILSLLEDASREGYVLQVPHSGAQKDRFTAAMRTRNARIEEENQPEWSHYCDKCVRWYLDEAGEGEHKKVSVIVIDGITIGHPCCGVAHCKIPLANNQDRFCPEHRAMEEICSVVDCSMPIAPNRKTCDDPEHQKLEDKKHQHDKAMFQLKARLQRMNVTHPEDAQAASTTAADEEEEFAMDHIDKTDAPLDPACNVEKPASGNRRIRARFGRRRTHNEEFIFRPCGMIVARETFYGSETTPQVVKFTDRVFRQPGSQPDIHIFDTGCGVFRHRRAQNDPLLHKIGFPVDPFHHGEKHKITDVDCQRYCNPHLFEELRTEDGTGWQFNASIAEQTNVWLGGFHSILREMIRDKYCFFLDEMILRRNQETRKKLEAQGIVVGNVPEFYSEDS